MDVARSAESLNRLTGTIIGAAIRIHRTLGPGLLESAYLACLAYELKRHGLPFEAQKAIPLIYDDLRVACTYRADLVVERSVVLEVSRHSRRLHRSISDSFERTSG